jgi:hypothetical protein
MTPSIFSTSSSIQKTARFSVIFERASLSHSALVFVFHPVRIVDR